MSVDLSQIFTISDEEVDKIVQDDVKHPNYTLSMDRAKTMNTWFEAEEDDLSAVEGDLFRSKSYIIKQSKLESDADYKRKLDRMRLFPLEAKFLKAQKRIYDENGVHRKYEMDTEDFWKWKESHFDDQGSSITEFFRDKVLFVKEVLGFGAVVTDLMVDGNGNTVLDDNNNVVPYSFVVRPHEIVNFRRDQGYLSLLVTRQSKQGVDGGKYHRITAYTTKNIYVYRQKKDSTTKELIRKIANPFGEVPATIIYGETDATSSFRVGKPRRFNLKGLYLCASELFYDLQQGSELFAHPVPAMSEGMAKSMAGIKSDQDYKSSDIKEEIGAVVTYPDGSEPPKDLFYQASMQGLQHLREVIFGDLMRLIFNLAMVRDKSIVKSNVSGEAKDYDDVEEQGLLSMTATDMENIEHEVIRRMAIARGEEFDDITVTYSKHYNLSSADEIWSDITEGLQYKGISVPLMKYLLKQYLSKRSAPQDVIDEVIDTLDKIGMPKEPSDLSGLKGILPDELIQKMAVGDPDAEFDNVEPTEPPMNNEEGSEGNIGIENNNEE